MYMIFGMPKKSQFQQLCDDLRADAYVMRIGTGSYKGTKEFSVMVLKDSASDFEFIQDCLRLARKYNQESILLVSDKGWGTLLTVKGDDFESTELGTISPVSEAEAHEHENYSCFGKIYFTFK